LEGSLFEAPFSDRPGQPSPLDASKNFGVDRCPVKLRIPKKQENGASTMPRSPTPNLKGDEVMRVCPNCGYVDPPEWRGDRYRWEKDYCTLEDFKRLHPDLAARLLAGHRVVCDEHFAYRLRGRARNYVERIWIKLYLTFGMSVFNAGGRQVEHVDHSKDLFQKKLLEVSAP
jgi:hypothetical protein